MTKRGAIYCRISDDREGKQLGVQRQEQDCRQLAETLGVTDLTLYVDNDIGASGRSKKRRPAYEQMLDQAEAGELDLILAYSNSRLTRRLLEFEHLIQLYERKGVKIRTVVSGEDDLSTADGRMTARIRASVDAAEAERAAERVTRAALQRAELGGGNGGTRPFGWQAADRTKLDPAEHAVITEVAARLLRSESARSVAADLNAREVPTVKGARWSPTALVGMMTNPRLAGVRVHKGEIVGMGDWEPALPETTVKQLERLLRDPARRISTTNRPRNLLTGIALCGECDRPVAVKVVTQAGRPRRARYHCAHCGLWRTKEPVDEYVTGVILEYLEQAGDAPPSDVDPEAIERVEKLRTRIKATQAAYALDDAMDPEDLLAAIRPMKDRLRHEEAAIRRVTRSPIVMATAGPGAEAKWERLTFEARRAIISELLEVRLLRGVRGRRGFDPASVELRMEVT